MHKYTIENTSYTTRNIGYFRQYSLQESRIKVLRTKEEKSLKIDTNVAVV